LELLVAYGATPDILVEHIHTLEPINYLKLFRIFERKREGAGFV
jgi:hypothetical protein